MKVQENHTVFANKNYQIKKSCLGSDRIGFAFAGDVQQEEGLEISLRMVRKI